VKIPFKSVYFRLFIYAVFYSLIMSYGQDLVQAIASQILSYMAWINNPELFQNDFFETTFPDYGGFSLWYRSAGWLSLLFPPMAVVYFLFFAQCFIEVFGIYFLSRKLFPELPESFSWITIVLFTFGGVLRYSLGSVAPFGWTVFPDVMVTGIMLFAWGFVIEKRFFPAFILAALSLHFHFSISFFVLITFSILYILNYKNNTLKNFLQIAVLSGAIIIPYGVGLMLNPPQQLTAGLENWVSVVRIHNGMHAFPSQFGLIQYIPFAFWIAVLFSFFKFYKNSKYFGIIRNSCLIMMGVLVISTIFIELYPIAQIISLSFFRSSRFFLIFAVFAGTALVYQTISRLREGDIKIWNPNLIKKFIIVPGIAAIVFFVFLNILFYHPVFRTYPGFVDSLIEDIELSESPLKSSLFFQTIKQTPEYIAAWKNTQIWCKNNTPEDKLILTPYYLRGFRSFSNRGIVFQFRDPPLMIYHYTLYEKITARTKLLGFSVSEYTNPSEYQVLLEKLYKGYDDKDLLTLAESLDLEYVVTERGHSLEFDLKYSNDYFNVYKIGTE